MKKIKIALVGQPNVGKSLLINALCKANMKVGNFSGVTIEKASAKTFYKKTMNLKSLICQELIL